MRQWAVLEVRERVSDNENVCQGRRSERRTDGSEKEDGKTESSKCGSTPRTLIVISGTFVYIDANCNTDSSSEERKSSNDSRPTSGPRTAPTDNSQDPQLALQKLLHNTSLQQETLTTTICDSAVCTCLRESS